MDPKWSITPNQKVSLPISQLTFAFWSPELNRQVPNILNQRFSFPIANTELSVAFDFERYANQSRLFWSISGCLCHRNSSEHRSGLFSTSMMNCKRFTTVYTPCFHKILLCYHYPDYRCETVYLVNLYNYCLITICSSLHPHNVCTWVEIWRWLENTYGFEQRGSTFCDGRRNI